MGRGDLSFREALVVSRPLWWVTTSVPFIVGALLAKEELSVTLIVGALYFLIPYNLLMYGVNDIFDYESDIRNERKNSAAHGSVLSKLKHPALWRWIAIMNVPFILYLMVVGNLESNVFLFMMIYMAFAYSVAGLRYKEIPVIDSLTSAFHYSSPFLFGLFLFESPTLWAPAFAGFYFWAVGNHAFGAIQDITPDRQAGIKSVATTLGAGKTIWFCLAAYALAIIAPLLGYGIYGMAAAAAILPYLLTILSTYRYRNNDRAPQFRAAWKRFVVMNYVVGFAGSLILIYLYNR
jgi:4-hydroxybenzoate polyprenyltransferase